MKLFQQFPSLEYVFFPKLESFPSFVFFTMAPSGSSDSWSIPHIVSQLHFLQHAAGYIVLNMISFQMTTSSPTTQSSSEPLKLPKLKAPPQDSSKPFPLVTSGEIGWRSGKMEIYGRESRPRFSIVNQLRWPNDAVP